MKNPAVCKRSVELDLSDFVEEMSDNSMCKILTETVDLKDDFLNTITRSEDVCTDEDVSEEYAHNKLACSNVKCEQAHIKYEVRK